MQGLAAAGLSLPEVAGLLILPGEDKQFRGGGHARLDYRPLAEVVYETYAAWLIRVSWAA